MRIHLENPTGQGQRRYRRIAIAFPFPHLHQSRGAQDGKQRRGYFRAEPKGFAAFAHLNTYVGNYGLEHYLPKVVMAQASQINGCASCLNIHTEDPGAAQGARAAALYASGLA